MDRDALLDALDRETAAFAAGLATADLDGAVPACPEWDVRTLVAHVAGVHRWARNAVVEGQMREDPTPDLPDRAAAVAWYEESAARLREALRTTPPGTPCAAFGPHPRTVDFWVRRQPHETAVHRWDLARAAGEEPRLDEALSADGLDEVRAVFVPRMQQRGLLDPLPYAVALRHPAGQVVLGPGEPSVEVRGSAATLLLVLWGRLPLDALDGDVEAARPVLSLRLTP